jgi:hypothetical protein
MNPRRLKIEVAGDFYRHKTYPKIRLQGHWLAHWGFPPSARVLVIPVAAGQLTLQVENERRDK